jgi:23S rRNA U2552 (ribose-2'-O)-methylase RlmE/FtsJ/DNA-directed RNA polymerase subunit E'/Rpb7
MDQFYIQKEFFWKIVLLPEELDRTINARIQKRVIQELENKCILNVGHIQTNSIEIISKQQGVYAGSHTTGNVLFKLKIRCMAAQPVKGAVVSCRVTGKNNAGILAANYSMPFLMFIPKDSDDNALEFDQVSIYDTIEVEVLDWKLQAPPVEQYWIISRIANTRLNVSVITRLPKENLVLDLSWRPDYTQTLLELRTDLTGVWFSSLKIVRDKIDTDIKQGYIQKLALMANPMQDFTFRAMYKKRRSAEKNDTACWYSVKLLDGTLGSPIATLLKVSKNDILVRGDQIYVICDPVGSNEPMQAYPDEFCINIWSAHIRKFINEYELLRPDGGYKDQLRGLVAIPDTDKNVSRAYFKLYEMLNMREESLDGRHIFDGGNGDDILCMGEAPGGFINALIDVYGDRGNNITGVSISEELGRARVWDRLEDLMHRRYAGQVHIYKGDDAKRDQMTNLRLIGDAIKDNGQPGDILNLANQQQIADRFAINKAVLITADGGAPHDVDMESEIYHSRLIFAEILLALRCQKPGGNFILKIFDITTGLTVNLISILSHFYERIHLYKPKTSRLGSSEKYIVCMYFMPRDSLEAVQTSMMKILTDWTETWTTDGINLVSLFPNSPKIIAAVKEYNEIFMQKQTQFIRTGIDYSYRYNSSTDQDLEQYIKQTVNAQVQGPCATFYK